MGYMQAYKQWLKEFSFDKALVAELKGIADDEHEIEDRFYTTLSFGTAGMRGVIGAGLNRMNIYIVRKATRAMAKSICADKEHMKRGVVIAYDSRNFSDVFAKEAALVLCAAGIKTYLFESLRPVPVLSFTVRYKKAIAGIVITASHNAAQYNGYKAYWEDGGQLPPDRADVIQALMAETSFEESVPMDEQKAIDAGLLVYIGKDIDDVYMAEVEKLCVNPELAREMGDKIKIVYTPLHGSGNIPVRRMLADLGFTDVHVVKSQEKPNGNFPTVKKPNPEERGAFRLALKWQKRLGADLVFGTDPDCDRVGIAVLDQDKKAHILTGNQIGCLLLHYILSQKTEKGTLPKNPAAVKSIVSTEMVRPICEKYGADLFNVLTGFKFIAEKIQQFEDDGSHSFIFGFEESYGYLSGTEVRDKDGVNASMLIAECAAWYKKQGKTLYDALQMLFSEFGYYGESVKSFDLEGKDGLEKMQSIMKILRANPPKKFGMTKVLAVRDYKTGIRTLSDGAEEKIDLPNSNVLYYELEDRGWVCIRPSGTEPKIKLYVNAASDSAELTKKRLRLYMAAARKMLHKAGE